MLNQEVDVKPKYFAVRIDHTEYFSKEIQDRVDKIYTVYIFDQNEYTYCASITPSYCMHFAGTAVYAKDEDEYGTDEWGDFVEEIENANFETEPTCYYHVSTIDKMLKDNPDDFDGDFHVDDDWQDTGREALMQEMLEGYSGNPSW
jgi:hypothetical protein